LDAITSEKDILEKDFLQLKSNVTNATTQLRIMTRRYNKLKGKNAEYKQHFQNAIKKKSDGSEAKRDAL
jgi:hypothetical protein